MKIGALILLLASCARAEPLAVIGDSITAVGNSWANVMYRPDRPTYIMAQAGRTIRDYDLPRDWIAFNYKNVLYYLGTNDIRAEGNFFRVRMVFTEHMAFMQSRRFNPIVILPPVYRGYEQSSQKIRNMMRNTSHSRNIPVIDIAVVWAEHLTFDGIHPTVEGHQVMAEYIQMRLGDIL